MSARQEEEWKTTTPRLMQTRKRQAARLLHAQKTQILHSFRVALRVFPQRSFTRTPFGHLLGIRVCNFDREGIRALKSKQFNYFYCNRVVFIVKF